MNLFLIKLSNFSKDINQTLYTQLSENNTVIAFTISFSILIILFALFTIASVLVNKHR